MDYKCEICCVALLKNTHMEIRTHLLIARKDVLSHCVSVCSNGDPSVSPLMKCCIFVEMIELKVCGGKLM